MFLEIFDKIKAQLSAQIPALKLRDIQWYNGQYEEQPEPGKKPIFQCPAVFVEFGDWEPNTFGKIQMGQLDIIIHVVGDYLGADTQLAAHEALNGQVFKALHGFSALDVNNKALINGLQRVRPAKPVHDLRRMLVSLSTFRGLATDHGAEKAYTARPTSADIGLAIIEKDDVPFSPEYSQEFA